MLEHRHAPAVEDVDDFVGRFSGAGRQLVDRSRHIEKVLAGEFLLRIGRGIAARLDPEALLDDGRIVPEQRVDLVGAP